jgi:hypothetical protein
MESSLASFAAAFLPGERFFDMGDPEASAL